jgi:hypothetical protein
MMPVTLPLLPVDVDEHPVDKEKEVKQGAKFIAVLFDDDACAEVHRALYNSAIIGQPTSPGWISRYSDDYFWRGQ